MKKLILLFLTTLLALCLVGCGKDTDEAVLDLSDLPQTAEEMAELLQSSLSALPEAAADIVRNNCFDSDLNPACVPGRVVEQVLTITTGEAEPIVVRDATFIDADNRLYSYTLNSSDGEDSFSFMDPALYGELGCSLMGSTPEDCSVCLYEPSMYEYATVLNYRYPFFGIGVNAELVSDERAGDERVITLTQPSSYQEDGSEQLVFHLDSDNLLLSYAWTYVDWNGETVVRSAEFSYPSELSEDFSEVRDNAANLTCDHLCHVKLVYRPGTETEALYETDVCDDSSLSLIASIDGTGYTVYTDEALTTAMDPYSFADMSSGSCTLYVVFDEA